jgi:RHS repeat-associated protein
VWEQDWVYGEGQLVGGERVGFSMTNDNGQLYEFGGKRHYHLDHLGSVRMVSDEAGRSVSERYFAFGVTPTKAYQEQINWGDPHIDAMRFAGHQREFLGFINTENTDYLDYMHARYYDPNLGRFLSVDPGDVPEDVLNDSYRAPQLQNSTATELHSFPATFSQTARRRRSTS